MLDAIAGYISEDGMHRGMYTAMFVECIQGDIMDLKANDTTNPHRKMRRWTRRTPGIMYKTQVWFEEVGAERIPQKSIKIMRSAYKKRNMNYWYYLELGNTDLAVHNRERAQHMSKYVKSPDPDTEPHVSLKK